MTDVISKSNHQNSHSHLPAKSKRPLPEQYQTVFPHCIHFNDMTFENSENSPPKVRDPSVPKTEG